MDGWETYQAEPTPLIKTFGWESELSISGKSKQNVGCLF